MRTIRIKVHPDRTCTVSGLDVTMLSNMMTQVALGCYDGIRDHKASYKENVDDKIASMPELEDIIRANYATNGAWWEHMLKTTKLVEDAMSAGWRDRYEPAKPTTKAQRLKAVKDKIRDREEIDAIIREERESRARQADKNH